MARLIKQVNAGAGLSRIINNSRHIVLETKAMLTKLVNKQMGKSLQADATRTTVILVDLPDFTFYLKKGRKYRIEGNFLLPSTPVGGGIKVAAVIAGAPNMEIEGIATAAAAVAAARSAASGTPFIAATALALNAQFTGIVTPSVNGTIVFQAAQNAASGTTTIKAGSWVKCCEVS